MVAPPTSTTASRLDKAGSLAHAATPRAAIDDTRNEVAAQTAASLAAVTSAAYFAVDAQFMALPAFAMLGKLDGNTSYFNRLHELYTYNKTTLGLYDATARLYYRDASYIFPAKQTPNGKKLFWSRGNGWALAALARVLTELPLSDPARAEYVAAFKQMSGALKTVQRADGFWNMSLYDANHYPGPETSGTALVRLWHGLGHQQRLAEQVHVSDRSSPGRGMAWCAWPCIRTASLDTSRALARLLCRRGR